MIKLNSFKSKNYLAFGTLVVLSVILLTTVVRLFSVLEGMDSYVNKVADLKNHIHRVKDNENKMFLFDTKNKTFIETGWSQYSEKMDLLQGQMTDGIISLLEHDLTEDYNLIDNFTTLNEHFQLYYSLIDEVKGKIKKRGFGSLNMAGELDGFVQSLKVKSSMSEYEVVINEISNSIYSFNLVESEKNANQIKESIGAIINAEKQNGDSLGLAKAFNQLLVKFTEFAALSQSIGMTGSQGIRAELIHNSEGILTKCEYLEDTVKASVDKEKRILYFSFAGLALLQVVIAIFFGVKMSSGVVENLNKIKSNITALSSGTFPTRITDASNDELGVIANAINELTDRIEFAANYAREIGKGNLDEVYKEQYSNDAIAEAIKEMQVKLKSTAEVDRLRAWRTEGLANFANVLQKNKDNAEELCFNVISTLVKYVSAKQGAFYIVEEQEGRAPFLKVGGAYAYDRVKFLDIELEKGEGLVGEAWKEEEMVVLTEVPADYFVITSGLGESLPDCIVIIPLVYNEQIYGMLEIASFQNYKEAELEFMGELAQNIASTLAGTKVNERTKALLENSQKMQEEMREQEEMMRQNIEEMQATQDTFEEREQQYLDEIKELKKR